ncbi:MAG: flagellar hook-basal body complex protein [Candidatus Kuenenia sp.]|nr:flagellar hook-basal body complex protein [Candidatus Kuenenia hertensis]
MGFGGALYAGVTGIRSHQNWMDVIGNNLSNINTYGYKSSRLLFSDLISQDKGNGGVNPMQIGMGVKNGSISSLFSQGTLESTNNEFDFAIQGNGFFVLNGGDKNFFTRVGTFATDANNLLVDSTTGYRILDSSGKTITIPYDSSVSATKTSSITLTGTLESTPSDSSGEVLLLSSALTYNNGTVANTSTDLNDLDTNTTNYSTNDTITVSGTLPDGTSFSDDFYYGTDGTTVNDFMNWLSNQSTTLNNTATVSLSSSGKIIVTSGTSGADDLTVTISDSSTDTSTWTDYDFLASTYTTSTTIYDSQGTGHNVTLTFIKKSDGVWDMRASMSSKDGSITDSTISSVTFNDDGSLKSAGDTTLTFKFDGLSTSQNVVFSLGTFGKSDGIYQSGKGSSVTASDQDGSESGNFSSFSVDTDGTLYALYSNGTQKKIAQLQIALFGNQQGLRKTGDNLYEQTDASGEPLYTTGGTGSAGEVYNGYLEASNVDMTSELTSLIMAQRGFQLNSRVITTADEVLGEAVNLKR